MKKSKTRVGAISARHLRIRKKVKGTKDVPRLSIYRSLQNLYVQLVDDTEGKTLCAASTLSKDFRETSGLKESKKNIATANLLGKYIGEVAKKNKIEKIVFDRSGYKYHGKVKAIADGARESGLKF